MFYTGNKSITFNSTEMCFNAHLWRAPIQFKAVYLIPSYTRQEIPKPKINPS